ncbi:ABC transporter ATP-binding protein [Alicyclobacillus sp. SO9]|uniref:ABC transporter ATP-binding protein n=1 Tax=Alicyclobacillus sp. SO9 TaxID=2665646 RepID=UPI0018E833C7|nr:ABC transporter ATP-binding protein [Alicyclobacillus sp. SO9]QQE78413.1 ABC transporter ATP-binding protein [Alicyclobacillus sp. SO9]
MSQQHTLKVDNLSVLFRDEHNDEVKVLKNVSFEVPKGKLLAIVGESGCGKSVTVNSVVQLLPNNAEITSGTVDFNSEGEKVDLLRFDKYGKDMRKIRGKKIGMIFQDPIMSLNPSHRIGRQVSEKLLEHQKISRREAKLRAVEMLKKLGISDPERRINEYPHQFSGGMRQRVMIAIAMISNPELLIADEPTTALDVTIQAQIMDLIKEIQKQYSMSVVLITHNMGLVAETADYVAVMYMGRIMEYGTVEDIINNPRHPYTAALLKSVPTMGLDKSKQLASIQGNTPNPKDYNSGCEFVNRCNLAMDKCSFGTIPEVSISESHRVRCVLFEDRK